MVLFMQNISNAIPDTSISLNYHSKESIIHYGLERPHDLYEIASSHLSPVI